MQHVFISYMHENMDVIDTLCEELTSRDIKVWLDRNDIKPGAPWKDAIRDAIRDGAFFIACFSKEYNQRNKTYMNEELTIAIEELRQRPTDRIWFIPVKLNRCEIPDRNIGGGETLNDRQHVKLYKDWDVGIQRIIEVIQHESPEPLIGKNAPENEIDQNAYAEFAKGLARQNSITETTSPEERREKIQEAFYHYSKALEIKPNYVDARNARGSIYIFMNKPEDAIQDFNMALKLDPNHFTAYFNRGNVYKNKKMYEHAINDYNKFFEINPNIPPANLATVYRYRAECYIHTGNFFKVIEDYSTAIELDPDFALAYYNRGIINLQLQNYYKVKSDFTTAKNLGMDIITTFHNHYENVEDFEQKKGIQLPSDIAEMLTQQ